MYEVPEWIDGNAKVVQLPVAKYCCLFNSWWLPSKFCIIKFWYIGNLAQNLLCQTWQVANNRMHWSVQWLNKWFSLPMQLQWLRFSLFRPRRLRGKRSLSVPRAMLKNTPEPRRHWSKTRETLAELVTSLLTLSQNWRLSCVWEG